MTCRIARRLWTCRSCGAQSRVWGAGSPCPHCGAPEINRISPERVKAELDAIAVLYGNQRPSPAEIKRQLDLFGK